MQKVLADLITHLELERLEVNLFRGDSRDIGSERVFGGQVLGQALAAAMRTVQQRPVHSLHAYFLRPGDINAPIVYDVDRARDGKSFSMRRVTAIQHGQQIFNLSASFHKSEEGLQHQAAMPEVPPPDALPSAIELAKSLGPGAAPRLARWFARERPFDFRFVDGHDLNDAEPRPPSQQIWLRAVDELPDNDDLHRVLLAYVSDFHLIGTATRPHNIAFSMGKLQMASLDHAMWFHRPFRADNWLLYSMDSPGTAGARGFARGQLFSEDGNLVASTAQEGLVRMRSDDKA